jgi:hypothetical protein
MRWCRLTDLRDEALPNLMRKVLAQGLGSIADQPRPGAKMAQGHL